MIEQMFASTADGRKRQAGPIASALRSWRANDMQGQAAFGSRTKALSLAFLFAAAALVGFLTVIFPHEQSVEVGALLAVAVFALAEAGAILYVSGQMSELVLHLFLAAVTSC